MRDIIRISKKNKEEKIKLVQKIINFIKYHNGFTFGIFGIFIAMSSVLATSPQVREAIIGKEVITEQGMDNSQLLSADAENFDINLRINNVLEDEENYYVDYTFNTIAVRDNTWQPVIKSEKFTVNKTALGNRDLGIYLAEQLSEVIRSEMTYLKEAQKNERERGLTQIVRTTDYTGLIGLILSPTTKALLGYEPVVKPEEIMGDIGNIRDTGDTGDTIGDITGDINGYSDTPMDSTSSPQADTTGDASTTPEQDPSINSGQDAYYQDLIDQARSMISGQATELINATTIGDTIGDITGDINGYSDTSASSMDSALQQSSGQALQQSSGQADLIDQAIDVLDKGQQEQQIIENLKQELTVE
jgi:hypothetical protein